MELSIWVQLVEFVASVQSVKFVTWVTLASAVATLASAAFIAWQAWETRRSALASDQSAKASLGALAVANQSLVLNQEQARLADESLALSQELAEQSGLMAIETIKARLEVNAPAVSMQFEPSAAPTYYLAGNRGETRSPFGVLPTEPSSFVIPHDNELSIYAVFRVEFNNDGLVPCTVESKNVGRYVSGTGFMWEKSLRIDVGKSESMLLAVGATLDEWTKVPHEASSPCGKARWNTALSGESGIQLSQEITIDGSPIGPVGVGQKFPLLSLEEDAGAVSQMTAKPQKRVYVLGGYELPAVDLGKRFGIKIS